MAKVRVSRGVPLLVGVVLVPVLGVVDYLTGYELGFAVFYLIPVSLVAWTGGRRWGVSLALAAAIAWFTADLLAGHPYSHSSIPYWNASVRLGFFLVVVFLLTARRRLEEERARLIAQLEEALAKVKTLRGLLPICVACKRIRDDQGYWSQLEVYVRSHSEADFTHGICPDCEQRLYAELRPQG